MPLAPPQVDSLYFPFLHFLTLLFLFFPCSYSPSSALSPWQTSSIWSLEVSVFLGWPILLLQPSSFPKQEVSHLYYHHVNEFDVSAEYGLESNECFLDPLRHCQNVVILVELDLQLKWRLDKNLANSSLFPPGQCIQMGAWYCVQPHGIPIFLCKQWCELSRYLMWQCSSRLFELLLFSLSGCFASSISTSSAWVLTPPLCCCCCFCCISGAFYTSVASLTLAILITLSFLSVISWKF